jgi:outer membrane protein assembly factor BamE
MNGIFEITTMRALLILLSMLLASCGGLAGPLTPYKMDIRQGNFVTAEMREKLKLGMSRQQVRYVLGTPMVSDAFHGNRWDYVYLLEQHGKLVEDQRLTLYFDGDNLVKVDDGAKPAQGAPASAPETTSPAVQPDPAAEVLLAVQQWAAAWSAKNARQYLAFYAPEFKPEGMSRADWEKQRVDRISRPKAAKVELSNLKVGVLDDSHAAVTFTQTYRSDLHQDVMRKTLQMEKVKGVWLIFDEQVDN